MLLSLSLNTDRGRGEAGASQYLLFRLVDFEVLVTQFAALTHELQNTKPH
jgi:hypothetical protein